VSITGIVAFAIIAIAFVSFFVMATIMYGQFALKAWRPFFMSVAVLLILMAIMKKATDIVTHERELQEAGPDAARP
jgi:hypothetical protein